MKGAKKTEDCENKEEAKYLCDMEDFENMEEMEDMEDILAM